MSVTRDWPWGYEQEWVGQGLSGELPRNKVYLKRGGLGKVAGRKLTASGHFYPGK